MSTGIAEVGHNSPPANTPEGLNLRLREDNAAVLDKCQEIIGAADRIPAEIPDAVIAGKVADYIKQCNGAKKKIEALRVSEKEPYLTLGRAVDGFFKGILDPLDVASKKALRPLDAYNKKVADEERRERERLAADARKKAEEEAMIAAAMEKAKQTPAAEAMIDQAAQTEAAAATLQKEAEAKPAHLMHVRGESGARAALVTRWVGEVVDLNTVDLEVLRHHLAPADVQKAVNSYVRAGGRELRGAKIWEESTTQVRG